MKKCKAQGCNNPKPAKGSWCGVCRNSKQRYGLTGPQREVLLEQQNSQCKLCYDKIEFTGTKSQYSACIDHNHKTNQVRGILCGNCNTWLGYFENKPNLTISILNDYLQIK